MKSRVVRLVAAAVAVIGFVGFAWFFWLKPKGTLTTAQHAHGQHEEGNAASEPEIDHYTCDMHPQIRSDKPGECPICHMTLIPVYKKGSKPEDKKFEGMTEISSERQQMIGVRTQKVEVRDVVSEIKTTGRVAFDPELGVAIREFVEIARLDPSLRRSAVTRLRLLGLGDQEILALEAGNSAYANNNLYLPEGGTRWIYATIYPNEGSRVRPGQKALITISGGDETFEGSVRSLAPTVDPMTRSIKARIEIATRSDVLRPDTFVNVSIRIPAGKALVISKSAVVDTGEKKIVYVVHDGSHFQPRTIRTGLDTGEDLVVLEGLKSGEVVVVGATFMIDSESQLKSTLSGSSEHKH